MSSSLCMSSSRQARVCLYKSHKQKATVWWSQKWLDSKPPHAYNSKNKSSPMRGGGTGPGDPGTRETRIPTTPLTRRRDLGSCFHQPSCVSQVSRHQRCHNTTVSSDPSSLALPAINSKRRTDLPWVSYLGHSDCMSQTFWTLNRRNMIEHYTQSSTHRKEGVRPTSAAHARNLIM